MRRQIHCVMARERLHGYVDGALPEAEMQQVEAHLTACDRCRVEVVQFRNLKLALRSIRTPADSADAADRVVARFRQALSLPAETESPAPPRVVTTTHWWGRHPLVSYGLAAAASVLVAFLTPVFPGDGDSSPLPSPAEMSLLSHRHDLHVDHAETHLPPATGATLEGSDGTRGANE